MLKFKFDWIIENKLAAGNQPGLYGDLEKDLYSLKNNDISIIVSLIEKKIDFNLENKFDFNLIHFPIDDMGISTPRKVFELCTELENYLKIPENKAFIHCKAGLGRTGTILESYLIHNNLNDEEAIKKIRDINKAFIQNTTQERFVKHYYDFYKNNK